MTLPSAYVRPELVCGFRSFECNIVRKRRDLNMLDDYLAIEEPHIVEIIDLEPGTMSLKCSCQ